VALSSTGPGGVGSVGLLLAITLGAVTGDHLGYAIGRRSGSRIHSWAPVRRMGDARWGAAQSFVHRRGAGALVVGRLVPVVRTLLPIVAGAATMRYRSFLWASVCGCLLWAAVWFSGGALLRNLTQLSDPTWVVLAATVVVTSLAVWLGIVRPRRQRGTPVAH
jgi:membrane-associated protein